MIRVQTKYEDVLNELQELKDQQKALREECTEAKGLVSFLTDQDVSQQIVLKMSIEENVALKRKFQLHQILNVFALVGLGVAALLALMFSSL